ncbi:MAG TPA: PAS domain-containing protein [Candidatus Limnocylindria bacterium]
MPGRTRLFVFEHDPQLSALLAEIFGGPSYRVVPLSASDSIPELVAADQPQVALIDFPPDRAGREVSMQLIERLRAAAAPDPVGVVALTADLQLVHRASERFARLPDFAILSKPFNLDELLDVVTALNRYVRDHELSSILNTPTPMLVLDAEGRIRRTNRPARTLLGPSLAAMRAARFTDLFDGSPQQRDDPLARLLRERSLPPATVSLGASDPRLQVQVHAAAIQGNDGAEPLLVAWVRPLT